MPLLCSIDVAGALESTGLAETFKGDGSFTVFAPPDSAFGALPQDLLTKLSDPLWLPQLKDVSDAALGE